MRLLHERFWRARRTRNHFFFVCGDCAAAECLATQFIQRNTVKAINDELYKGFRKGDPEGNPQQVIREYVNGEFVEHLTFILVTFSGGFGILILLPHFEVCVLTFAAGNFAAYDFGNTDRTNFDVSIFWNQTLINDTSNAPPGFARVSRPMNLVILDSLRSVSL